MPDLVLTITSPEDGVELHLSPVTVTGTVNLDADVTVNGIQATVVDSSYSAEIDLTEGPNSITVTAVDIYGRTETAAIQVTLTYLAPTAGISADPETITAGQSATLTWTSAYADTCIIDSGIGPVTLNGSTTVSPAATTTYTITATGPGGTNTANVTVAVNQITLTITSPNNGVTINSPDIMVQGTVTNASSLETGIVVNGILAMVYGNQFVANHVPLQEGENTIAATATDAQGNTASDSITVNAENIGDYIKITALLESGISALETRLSIDGTFSFTESTLTHTGPGTGCGTSITK